MGGLFEALGTWFIIIAVAMLIVEVRDHDRQIGILLREKTMLIELEDGTFTQCNRVPDSMKGVK